ncbi:hypothetical protein Zm00014a_026245 [Zea mays]|uniref:Uncharacterized protein n=1 Tax=Zea mays TaxID=4577 RepID=A0A3L6E8C0_MAIZE|nr:hypothetical protein Zm00014a_026245 [Zea mays]
MFFYRTCRRAKHLCINKKKGNNPYNTHQHIQERRD